MDAESLNVYVHILYTLFTCLTRVSHPIVEATNTCIKEQPQIQVQ